MYLKLSKLRNDELGSYERDTPEIMKKKQFNDIYQDTISGLDNFIEILCINEQKYEPSVYSRNTCSALRLARNGQP